MTKESKTGKDTKAPKAERQAPPQPSYVQFQGGFQSGRNNSGGGGKRPAASGSPIRKSAPPGGGK